MKWPETPQVEPHDTPPVGSPQVGPQFHMPSQAGPRVRSPVIPQVEPHVDPTVGSPQANPRLGLPVTPKVLMWDHAWGSLVEIR